MKGWKTWAAAALIGGVAAAEYMGMDPALGKLILGLAAALGVVGLGHKIEKAGYFSGTYSGK